MSELSFTQTVPHTEEEYLIAIEGLFAEMDRLHVKMAEDQARIRRLTLETLAIKAETATIKARTQARLDVLEKMV